MKGALDVLVHACNPGKFQASLQHYIRTPGLKQQSRKRERENIIQSNFLYSFNQYVFLLILKGRDQIEGGILSNWLASNDLPHVHYPKPQQIFLLLQLNSLE